MRILVCLICLFPSTVDCLYSQWNVIYQNEDIGCIKDLEFIDADTGFFVGSGKFIGQTFNNGGSWSIDSSYEGSDFRIIDFINADTGLICCSPYSGDGDVLITYDSGNNWFAPELDNGVSVTDIELVDGGNVIYSELSGPGIAYSFIADNYYEINIWSIDIAPATFLWQEEFPSKDVGFITGEFAPLEPTNSTVYKTIDGGLSWYSSDNMFGPKYSINFPSLEIGYGIGDEKRVWKTINEGENWQMLPFDFGGYEIFDGGLDIGGIYFFNDTIGYLEAHYIPSDEYKILKTVDGGNSWYPTVMLDEEFNGLTGFFCVSGDTCFAFSCDEIYKTINGGGEDSVTTIFNSSLNNLNVKVYPNPAINEITLQTPTQIITEIHTFNLIGSQISLSFDKNQSARVTQLPPGIYYTEIKTSNGEGVIKWVKI